MEAAFVHHGARYRDALARTVRSQPPTTVA
jgi:hypothetical protein